MKKEKKIQELKEMKTSLLSLYDLYLKQAGQKNIEMNSYHENGHDNSGGHPNFHCNQHDNTPSRMMRLVLTKNGTN